MNYSLIFLFSSVAVVTVTVTTLILCKVCRRRNIDYHNPLNNSEQDNLINNLI